jgi:hypothetical protein
MQVAGHVEAYVCNELRLTVDQAKRTWHFWHQGTWALKFYTAEVRHVAGHCLPPPRVCAYA